MITKEVLEKKLAGYEETIRQLKIEILANQGAAAAIKGLLQEAEKPAESEKKPAKKTE